MGGQGAVASDAQDARAGVEGARFGQEVVAKNRAGTAPRIALRQVQADTAVVRQRERDFRVRQRDALDGVERCANSVASDLRNFRRAGVL